MQVVHLFYSYLKVEPDAFKPAVFAVPTGAGGHIAAAILGARMGLPVEALLACTNDNDLLPKFLETGVAMKGEVHNTTSPAMDVQVPYNIERILHLATNGDSARVKQWMTSFYSTGKFKADADVMEELASINMRAISMRGPYVKEAALALHSCCGYLIDPHTSVGMAGLRQYLNSATSPDILKDGTPLLCMACAHPAKFPGFVQQVFECGEEEALERMPDSDHRWVQELLGVVAATQGMQPPCDAVFEEADGSQWIEKLTAILEGLLCHLQGKA